MSCSNDTGVIVERDPDTVRGPDVMFFDEPTPWTIERSTDGTRTLASKSFRPMIDRNGLDESNSSLRRHAGLAGRPEERTSLSTAPARSRTSVDDTEELTGEDVLPDFRCRVAEFFVCLAEPACCGPTMTRRNRSTRSIADRADSRHKAGRSRDSLGLIAAHGLVADC